MILLIIIVIAIINVIIIANSVIIVISTMEECVPGAVVSQSVPRVAQRLDAVLFLPLRRTTSQTLAGPAL